MTTEQTEVFIDLIKELNGDYPHRDIRVTDKMVCIDGKCAFNTDGFNLLFNLTRLCKELSDELI